MSILEITLAILLAIIIIKFFQMLWRGSCFFQEEILPMLFEFVVMLFKMIGLMFHVFFVGLRMLFSRRRHPVSQFPPDESPTDIAIRRLSPQRRADQSSNKPPERDGT